MKNRMLSVHIYLDQFKLKAFIFNIAEVETVSYRYEALCLLIYISFHAISDLSHCEQ